MKRLCCNKCGEPLNDKPYYPLKRNWANDTLDLASEGKFSISLPICNGLSNRDVTVGIRITAACFIEMKKEDIELIASDYDRRVLQENVCICPTCFDSMFKHMIDDMSTSFSLDNVIRNNFEIMPERELDFK